MISLIGAVLVMLVGAGGYFCGANLPLVGVLLASPGTVGLAILIAHMQRRLRG
jgi:hypothetical protein